MGRLRLGWLALMAGVVLCAIPAHAQFGTRRAPPPPPPPPIVTPDPLVVRLTQRVDELELLLRDMTGRLEQAERDARVAREENERLGRQLDDLSANLATRAAPFAEPNSGEVGAQAVAGTSPVDTGAPPPEPISYAAAMSRLGAGDYQGAERDLRAFIEASPDAPEAADARFWLGESLYVQGAYGEAAQAYVGLLRADPNAARAPDALVKLAGSLRQIDQPEQACAAISEFRKRFPRATPILKARADAEATRNACAA